MSKISEQVMTELLVDAILSLESREECLEFFEDLCTFKELQDMSQRLDVAVMLRNKMKYNDIADKTGASTATISRVNKYLIHGNDAYNTVLDRIKK